MLSFIKQHWVAYVIGAAVALALGFGVSYVLGIKWSTPPEVRAQRIEAEQTNKKTADQIADLSDGQDS